MTWFIVICAAMLSAALLWLLVPLWRAAGSVPSSSAAAPSPGAPAPSAREHLAIAIVAGALPLLAVLMYVALSHWDWRAVQETVQRTAQIDDLLQQLEARLEQNPTDIEGWLLLGRANAGMKRYQPAIDAYQRAYELSQGRNMEALLGLGEALMLSDEPRSTARATALFEEALRLDPDNPQALWFGSIAALQSGALHLARERLARLLAHDPPDELRDMLERQIRELDRQLGTAGTGDTMAGEGTAAPPEAPAAADRTIN